MKKTLFTIVSLVLCLASFAGCTNVGELVPNETLATDTATGSDTGATQNATQTGLQTDTQDNTDIQSGTQTGIQTGSQSESQNSEQTLNPSQDTIDIQTQTQMPEFVQTETNIEIESDTQTEPQPETEIGTETQTSTQTEKPTEKPTEKQTEKATEKVDPIPGVTKTTDTLKSKIYKLNQISTYYRYVGRVKPTSDGLIFDHSASTLEVQGYMTGKVELKLSTDGKTYYTVYIDGKRSSTRFEASGSNQTLTIANFSGKYFHKITIVKQTEVDWSTSTLHSLTITGKLTKAPAKKDLYIEFYGDSLTAGYGNIGKPGDEPSGSAPYEDATKTYAYLLSEKLDADCSILARSGVGLAPCWSECFQDRFKKYSFSRSNELFDFKGARVPDLVVIHLGANDYVYGSSKEKFIEHGKALIKFIREGYGKDIPIIWAHDPGEGRPAWISEMLDSLGGEAKGFYTVALPWSEAGAGGHPSANEHQKHANIVYNLINKKKLLK